MGNDEEIQYYINKIDVMLSDKDYDFAKGYLSRCREWIFEHNWITEKQIRMIDKLYNVPILYKPNSSKIDYFRIKP